jgi:hypothetical protein
MLKKISMNSDLVLSFDRDNLSALEPYFNLDFLNSDVATKVRFFENLQTLSRRSLGLAHSIQHNAVARIIVQLSDCESAKDRVFGQPFDKIIGCYSIVKRSDQLTLKDNVLNGQKNWFSNLDQADFGVLQFDNDGATELVYFDMLTLPHELDYSFFKPIGMEIARAGALKINNHVVPAEHMLGRHGTQRYFQQSNFASYCFLSNHCGLAQELFLDLKTYAEKYKCGAEFEIKKLEMDIASLVMQWQDNLPTVGETAMSNQFWNRRNTQYAFSKKTLIRVVQLILELGVSYYVDAKSEFSQRFRDALTYSAHMHPLYKFGQEFHMLNLSHTDD